MRTKELILQKNLKMASVHLEGLLQITKWHRFDALWVWKEGKMYSTIKKNKQTNKQTKNADDFKCTIPPAVQFHTASAHFTDVC